MGNTIWVQVQGRPTSETASDSSIMHRLMDNLDALAEKLHVRKLSEFYDYSALNAAFAESDEEADEESDDIDEEDQDIAEDDSEDFDDDGQGDEEEAQSMQDRDSKGEWFDSEEGLKSIRSLTQHLKNHFEELGFVPDRSMSHWPADLIDEMIRSTAIIEEAAAKKQRFRLLIVP